jgi:hypothetical protein
MEELSLSVRGLSCASLRAAVLAVSIPVALLIVATPVKAGPATLHCGPNADRVWLYDSPVTYNVIAQLKCGESVEVTGRAPGYLKVRSAAGQEGYVPQAALPELPPPADGAPPGDSAPHPLTLAEAAALARHHAVAPAPVTAASSAPANMPAAVAAVKTQPLPAPVPLGAARPQPAAPPSAAAPAPAPVAVAKAEVAPAPRPVPASPPKTEIVLTTVPEPAAPSLSPAAPAAARASPQPAAAPAAPATTHVAVAVSSSKSKPAAHATTAPHPKPAPAPAAPVPAAHAPESVAASVSAPAAATSPSAQAGTPSEATQEIVLTTAEESSSPAAEPSVTSATFVSNPANPIVHPPTRAKANDDEEEDTVETAPSPAAPNCTAYFSAYGLSPNQYKWIVTNRKKYPGICPAPTPAMVDFVVIFTHDVNFYNSTMPTPVRTDPGGLSDWTPMSTEDSALVPVREMDKNHREYVWIFHTKRGAFDPARFSSKRRPLFEKSESNTFGSHAGDRTAEDALRFITENRGVN